MTIVKVTRLLLDRINSFVALMECGHMGMEDSEGRQDGSVITV